jgi:hypothetical protein
MRSDVNYSHSKNIGEQVGNFCDVPILTYDNFELELDVAVDSMRTVEGNKAMGCSDIPNTAEILPGELLCPDNMVRRETTAEVTGKGLYAEGIAYGSEKLADLCARFSVMTSANNLRGKKGQSTPEEMCAWLNEQPKRRFLSRVETDGADKLFITDDLLGNRLYAFRYFEGTPGTYIGGDEVRPLDPPQFSLGKNSPTRVIQYFDTGNAYKHTPVELKEWKDEFRCNERYTPTSNVSRSTIGGTALFDELKEAIELDKATVEPMIELLQPQTCEWFPDGEFPCGAPITHAATKERAGTCDSCYAAREARG